MSERISITERHGIALASLIARRGQAESLQAAIRDRYGAELPVAPHFAHGADGAMFIWTGPERWLVASTTGSADALVASLRACADGCAAICDQSDGRMLLRVSGPCARAALAKGIPLDLHPAVFSPGSTAVTIAAHIGCQLWQVDDTPTYDIAVPSSFGASFRHWLDRAVAEFVEQA